jgi:hypothetical protein
VIEGGAVLWIDHRDQRPEMLSGTHAAETRQQLGWLHEGGAEVHMLRAHTRAALAALASAWGIEAPAPPGGRRALWKQRIQVAERDRRRATLDLFHLMGLHHEVADVLEELGGPVTPDEWGIAARSSWAAGRYREAALRWQRAHPGADAASQILLDERRGACEWIRGRYLRAYRTLRRTLERAAAMPEVDARLELRLRVAETLGRVLVHMRRTPDTRLLSTRRRRRWVLEQLPDPDAPGQRLGTHFSAQLGSVRTDLGGTAGADQWKTAQAAFAEDESLNAQLNYHHAELRHAVGGDAVDARRFRQLRQDFQTIGADGDAARVPLIPGAEAAFTILETASGLQQVDMTRWHRCRLMTGFVIRQACHWVRGRWGAVSRP